MAEVPVRKADSRRDWLGASQVVTVSVDSSSSTWHRMQLWQRGSDGRFVRVGSQKLGWVGEAGIGQANSWTARTPAGTYTLTQSFGIKSNPGTRLPFSKVDRYDWWNGDSTSPGYNTRYRGITGPPNSEHLLSYGKAYWYSVVIDYNTERTPYAGAAFFLHVATGEPTGGCVSVSEAHMVEIMRWLDPGLAPVITIGVTSDATGIVDKANA
jgi:L,D-peptidoglycan transpeptidase YkuD (ErfK/YbiS/YcfS/YnhG family)